MHTLIYSVLPVFIIVGLGYVARKLQFFKARWIDALIGYVYYVALPALIVTSIVNLNFENNNIGSVLVWNIVFLIISAILCLFFMKLVRIKKKDRAVFFLAAIVSNTIYLGIPLTTSVLDVDFGSSGYALLVLIGVIQLMGSIFIALVVNEFLFVGNKNVRSIATRLAKNPLVIAIAAGVLFAILPVPDAMSDVAMTPLVMLAASASPVALFVLGTYLYGHAFKASIYEITMVTVWKLAFAPLLAYAVVIFMQPTDFVANGMIIFASMPTAVTALIIAKSYKFNTDFIAATILVGTVISILTISGIIIALGL
ncbi:Auxin efflux carrier [sediment metagenome]|uniref:Auxin efflux carrier n=1 Tax=sediment metagenome TaxID=749907 RepID=D9PLB0_9ZZZZ